MREYPKHPVVAVGAVVLKGPTVLLVQRGREPNRHRWSLPGGVVRLGERFQDALIREVREECGIEVEVRDLLEVVDRVHHDQGGRVRYHYVIIDFLAAWKSGRLKAGSDVLAARWVPLEGLAEYPLTDGLVEVIGQGLQVEDRRRGDD